MRILIIEDNPDIVANLYGFLEPKGFVLDSVGNGYAALALLAEQTYDVIVLDVMLPGLSGIDVCRRLRSELHSTTPVLMLTARDTLEDKQAGFNAGADDYLVKPFSLVELELRINALHRRASGEHRHANILAVGPLSFNTDTYQVTRDGMPLALTKTGFVILRCLMRESPKLVPRDMLEQEVWGEDRPESDALRTHLHALRQVLDKPFAIPMLRTVPGLGYQLTEPNESV
ncbi:response regulator transcription factor [Massilia sp. CF038]|uniref:response regulator transcription factor n=1 Tax=Massilia sp. CF038 TaxID=1881045 RepID=UPI000922D5F2|nr:response regulator transcription factor [Massilia sp. CF038]SHH30575.1 DNA-binding response regulator, OmpR family, contains REC and winged-helix (wHTH) domain [Massilia sp. CF038]